MAALLLLSICAFAEDGKGPVEARQPQLLQYESKGGGYSIELPALWDVKPSVKGFNCVAFAQKRGSSDIYLPNISVAVVKDGRHGPATESFLKETGRLEQGFSLLSKGECIIGQLQGTGVEFAYISDGARLKARKVFLSKDGTLWIVSFMAPMEDFKRLKPLFDAVELSFKPF